VAAGEKSEDTLKEVTRTAKRHAQRRGLALQPDATQLRYVLNGLAETVRKYGKPFCPCKPVSGDAEKDRRNICPCRTHREEIEQSGECECGLFTRRSDNLRKKE
jgi:ferredoxin-thioredoxin reductase catalytic subunit